VRSTCLTGRGTGCTCSATVSGHHCRLTTPRDTSATRHCLPHSAGHPATLLLLLLLLQGEFTSRWPGTEPSLPALMSGFHRPRCLHSSSVILSTVRVHRSLLHHSLSLSLSAASPQVAPALNSAGVKKKKLFRISEGFVCFSRNR